MKNDQNTIQMAAGSQNARKSIVFYLCKRNAVKRGFTVKCRDIATFESFDVDTSSLSPLARAMAEAILTTDRRDDHSKVRLQSNRFLETDRPLFQGKEILLGTPEHALLCKTWAIKPIPCRWFYTEWDSLRPTETPEQFLERHAAVALDCGRWGQDDLVVLGGW